MIPRVNPQNCRTLYLFTDGAFDPETPSSCAWAVVAIGEVKHGQFAKIGYMGGQSGRAIVHQNRSRQTHEQHGRVLRPASGTQTGRSMGQTEPSVAQLCVHSGLHACPRHSKSHSTPQSTRRVLSLIHI
eukprot:9940862-Alexandrium_andersonii.AAC.1